MAQEIDWQWFTFSRTAHFKYLRSRLGLTLEQLNPRTSRLKAYQDAVIQMLLRKLPDGARVLEVGGGVSRVLPDEASRLECWNVDKFEGLGNGPTTLIQTQYKLIEAYIGDYDSRLPDNYFDFVFSISVLEHVMDESLHSDIIRDMNRVLRNGAISIHMIDIVESSSGGIWVNPLVRKIGSTNGSLTNPILISRRSDIEDAWVMGKDAYDKFWQPYTDKTYEDFGSPLNCAVGWRKV